MSTYSAALSGSKTQPADRSHRQPQCARMLYCPESGMPLTSSFSVLQHYTHARFSFPVSDLLTMLLQQIIKHTLTAAAAAAAPTASSKDSQPSITAAEASTSSSIRMLMQRLLDALGAIAEYSVLDRRNAAVVAAWLASGGYAAALLEAALRWVG